MADHTGPIRVYGPTRLRWLAPVLRLNLGLWILTWVALNIANQAHRDRRLVVLVAGLAVAAVAWLPWWVARLASPSVRISDRYRWDQVEKACATLIKYLPKASGQRRKQIRPRVEVTRWNLARAMADVDPLPAVSRGGTDPARVEERIRRLRDLAERSATIGQLDGHRRKAARLIARVDASIVDDAAPDIRPDPAGTILQRAEYTLDRYRELLDRKGGGR
jgi:hypothetical protein